MAKTRERICLFRGEVAGNPVCKRGVLIQRYLDNLTVAQAGNGISQEKADRISETQRVLRQELNKGKKGLTPGSLPPCVSTNSCGNVDDGTDKRPRDSRAPVRIPMSTAAIIGLSRR